MWHMFIPQLGRCCYHNNKIGKSIFTIDIILKLNNFKNINLIKILFSQICIIYTWLYNFTERKKCAKCLINYLSQSQQNIKINSVGYRYFVNYSGFLLFSTGLSEHLKKKRSKDTNLILYATGNFFLMLMNNAQTRQKRTHIVVKLFLALHIKYDFWVFWHYIMTVRCERNVFI